MVRMTTDWACSSVDFATHLTNMKGDRINVIRNPHNSWRKGPSDHRGLVSSAVGPTRKARAFCCCTGIAVELFGFGDISAGVLFTSLSESGVWTRNVKSTWPARAIGHWDGWWAEPTWHRSHPAGVVWVWPRWTAGSVAGGVAGFRPEEAGREEVWKEAVWEFLGFACPFGPTCLRWHRSPKMQVPTLVKLQALILSNMLLIYWKN